MRNEAVVVFTGRGLDQLIREGGSQAWKLNDKRARQCPYVVCVQNLRGGDWGEPTHAQGQAFLVGRITGVEPAPDELEERFIVQFDEYAEINIPDYWKAWRNPVRYLKLNELGFDPSKLTFKRVATTEREPPGAAPATNESTKPIDMAQAKKGLAAYYGVPASSIEITIRG